MSYTKHDGIATDMPILASDIKDMDNKIYDLDSDVTDLQESVDVLEPAASASDVGKALKVKTVAGGKVTAYEFGETAIIDSTLTEAGKAADAKATGDEISNLREQIESIEPGLSNTAKAALLACFAHVAWVDEHGQDYYTALENALYSNAELVSISATFNQGATIIYTDSSLEDLKQYLTVTANYSDSTTRTVTGYTLSGTLTEGTSIINVTYKSKTTTFTVNVTALNIIRNWDFTKSLTDTVSGALAETTATRNENGLTFTNANTYLDLGTVYSRNRTYEIDIAYIGEKYTSESLAYRRVFAFGENGTNTSANTAGLPLPKKVGHTTWLWYLGNAWDDGGMATSGDYGVFNGKTMKIYIDSNGYAHVYSKAIGANDSEYVKFGQSTHVLNDYNTSNAHVYAGGTSDALGSARFLAYRVYEGAK